MGLERCEVLVLIVGVVGVVLLLLLLLLLRDDVDVEEAFRNGLRYDRVSGLNVVPCLFEVLLDSSSLFRFSEVNGDEDPDLLGTFC